MIKRTLCFTNPAYLSMRDRQLVVRVDRHDNEPERQTTIPIEDIGVVVLDCQRYWRIVPLSSPATRRIFLWVFCCRSKDTPYKANASKTKSAPRCHCANNCGSRQCNRKS